MFLMLRKNNQDTGVTLIELLVAMTIASIVCGILFFSYQTLARNMHTQSKRVDSLQKAFVIKKKIDHMLGDIRGVSAVTEQEIDYIKPILPDSSIADSMGRIVFKQNALYCDGRKVIDTLGALTFKFTKNVMDKKQYALVWDGTTVQGIWIGGGVANRY